MLTASLFAKSSTIFYQQQCCLKTATIACFFEKKRAELRSYVEKGKIFGGCENFFYLCACVSTSYNWVRVKGASKIVQDYRAVTLYGMAGTAIMLSGNY